MEFLKELLDEETYAKVEEQLKDKDVKLADLSKGEYVSKDKYERIEQDLETTREELTERTNDLTKLSEDSNASEELKAKLKKLEYDFTTKEEKYQEQLKQNEINSTVEKAILKSGTIDEVSVKAHLTDFLKDAEYKDGSIVGLDEQLNQLKEDKGYLFEQPKGTGIKHKDALPQKQTEEEIIAQSMGLK